MTTRPERFRVVFVSWAPFFSGAERALVLTMQGLAEAGHEVSAIVGTDGDLLAQIRARGFDATHIPLPYTGLATIPAFLASGARCAAWLRKKRADLMHSNDAPSFQLAGYVAGLLRVPSVSHVRFPDTLPGFAWFFKPGFARALFVSEYLRRDSEAAAPSVFTGRSDVVYDGVELPRLLSGPERAAMRESLGVPNDRPAVLFAGQVVEIKGIFDFVEAAAILCRRDIRATFVVLGDDLKGQGATRRAAESRAQELGIASHMRFLGYRPDAPSLISLFDVVAVPSHVEPLGNATLEAMAAGRPVVGSRVGGIPEMIVDGVTGRLVECRNPPALAEAIGALTEDSATRESLGVAGRARAAEVFSIAAHARALAAIYRSVVAPR